MKNRNSLTPKTKTTIRLRRILTYTAGAAIIAGVVWKLVIGTAATITATSQAKAMYTPASGPVISGHNWESTITVSHTMVADTQDLTNFPLLVSVTDVQLKSEANGGYVSSEFGYDILFCNDTHNQLTHQIESYDPVTGTLVAWVNLPILYHSVDTELKITCGNPNITTNSSSEATWDNTIEAVWHMNDNPELYNLDDAAGTYDGVPYGNMTSADLVPGKIGGAIDFDGSNDYFAIADKYYTNQGEITNLTVSSWVKTTHSNNSWTSNWSILDFDRSEYFNFFVHGQGKISFCTRTAGGGIHDFHAGQSGQVNNGEWHYVTAVYDGSQKHLFVDGVLVQSVNAPGQSIGTGANRYGFIGDGSEANSFNGGRNGKYFKGQLDEIRFYNVALSPGRIITEYNNQNNPTGFITFGDTQTNLPIELDYFKAKLNEDAGRVEMKWSCVSQLNNDYFTLERSRDGNNFEEIGTVSGAGTTNQTKKYKFTDYDPLNGLSYYRLRQTDYDGKTEAFNAVAVHYILPIEAVDIQNVWPNPFTYDFSLEYTADTESEVTIQLYNSYGLRVFSDQVLATDGRNEYKFTPSSDLTPGVYILNIAQKGEILATRKLIKQ